ncbi:ATP-binding protein [Jatrophihabitans sp. YIM 134969]
MTAERIALELPSDLDAPSVARKVVADHGADLAPSLVADAVLCVSEVVSNAVLHGRPRITLRLDTTRGGLGVEVTDHGDPLDPADLPPVDDASPHGRGLRIVAALSREWGVRPGVTEDLGPNKTVWFELYPEPEPEGTSAAVTPA